MQKKQRTLKRRKKNKQANTHLQKIAQLTCRTCDHYQNSRTVYRDTEDIILEEKKVKRPYQKKAKKEAVWVRTRKKCRATNKVVDMLDGACKHHAPAKWLNCDPHQQRITVVMCHVRQQKRSMYDCSGCFQKAEMNALYEAMPDKPDLTKPKKRKPIQFSNPNPSPILSQPTRQTPARPRNTTRRVLVRRINAKNAK